VGALVRAGPARERERSSRRDAGDLGSSGLRCSVSETRCNGGAFRDRSSPASGPGHPSQMGGVRRRAKQCFATRLPHPWPLLVWPSLAKQLPPGTTIAPLTWQRHRHGSQKPPGPFYEARFVGAGPARERERSSRQDAREIANGGTNSVSGIPPAGFAGLSLARQAPTKPHSIERFGASDNPGPWRTGRSTGSVQGRIHSVPGRAEHRHATPDGGRELPEKGLWNPAGWLAPPFRGLGPLPQIAPTKLATGVRRRSAGRPPARRRRGG